jgi:adenylate cyclase
VRGSTSIAESLSPTTFAAAMNRFFGAANRTLIKSDAYIDKLVGDEVIGLYMPYLGSGNSRRAIEAAKELLNATGHQDVNGPWLPVGIGVNTGIVFIGSVGTADGKSDFTAMGDVVNVTARLSSLAGAGEILVGEAAWAAAAIESEVAEHRRLEVKGKAEPIDVFVLKVGPV